MRTLPFAALFLVSACSDSTGPEVRWVHDEYLMVSLGSGDIPASINASLTLMSGELFCPPAESGETGLEEYLFVYDGTNTQGQLDLSFEPVCEVEGTDQIRYTYPGTGETIVGTLWKGPQGQVFQRKQLPSRETYLAALGPLKWQIDTWRYYVQDPAPEGTFQRSR